MTRRENFYEICGFKTPEKITVDFCGCPLSGIADKAIIELSEFLGFGKNAVEYVSNRKNPLMTDAPFVNEKILVNYDIDTRGVGWIIRPDSPHSKIVNDNEYIDEWGVRRTWSGLYWENITAPLKGMTLDEMKAYPFPDPESIDSEELKAAAARAKYLYENTYYVICASHPTYGVFELGCWMCGFDDFLYRMAIEPEFVHCFFERVLDYQKAVSKIYYNALGNYIHYTSSGDDFATQNSTFFSIDMFDDLIAPYLKERISFTKKLTKAKFLHHSCGNVESLIPSLITCGVDILNPVQPVCDNMKPDYLKQKYAGKIVFHGGYDTQHALLKNIPAQIDAEIKAYMSDIRVGGGFIFAAAHNIQADIPVENIDAFLSASKKYK